mmetsp:Transcript_96904/g.257518  ORF Transcript_96904/g.257518 Transcript_96904/m.257518 type:complete len:250 (+) Transcript_96904:268-1017(+)
MRNRTTSTTRTRALCLEASSIRCEKPLSTSSAKRSSVFASPLPKREVSTPKSSSSCSMICVSTPRFDTFEDGDGAAEASSGLRRPCSRSLLVDHHSNVRVLQARLSGTVKDGNTRTDNGVAHSESKLHWPASKLLLVSLAAGALVAKRSRSSRRLSAVAASGKSGTRASRSGEQKEPSTSMDSSASEVRSGKIQGWTRACEAVGRWPSFLASNCRMKSASLGDTTLQRETPLCFTSHSERKGKVCSTRP